MDKWINKIEPDMLPEGLSQEIASIIGVPNFIKLSEVFGGDTIYLPKVEKTLCLARNMQIMEEFNGYNQKELAKKHNVSVRWIYELTKNITTV